jgi:hypothetical protein
VSMIVQLQAISIAVIGLILLSTGFVGTKQ